MNSRLQSLVVALAALLSAGAASAQKNVLKFGLSEYTTHSETNGVTGVGIPAGADAKTGDATTVILTYERMFRPDLGVELVAGLPPTIKAKATGSVAFLGDDILSAKNMSPTVFVNYHFNNPGDMFRPYLGVGLNYTKFVSIKSRLASDVKMSDSMGWAMQGGVDIALNKQWGLFASVAMLKVKSDLVAAGSTVLQTTVDFRPVVYTVGVSYLY